MRKNTKNNVCIIGLGFVGLTLAVSMATKGFRVYGIEKNKKLLKKLKKVNHIFLNLILKKKIK